MSAETLTQYFGRLAQKYEKYDIKSPHQVFNIDENGFAAGTAVRARSKALFDFEGGSN